MRLPTKPPSPSKTAKVFDKIQSKKGTLKNRICICINSLVSTRYLAYTNHIQAFMRIGRNFPDWDMFIFNPERMSIDRARNEAAKAAMEYECKYLLFIDDDVLIPFDGLKKLIETDADVVAGDVIIRGYPFNHMLFNGKVTKDEVSLKAISKLPKGKEVIDVKAVGFSFCLIKVDLLKKLSLPLFVTGPSNTEDIYFCVKALTEVPDTTIKARLDVTCAHILWDEVISSHNKKAYKKYYETMNPEVKIKESGDRGIEYVGKAKALLG